MKASLPLRDEYHQGPDVGSGVDPEHGVTTDRYSDMNLPVQKDSIGEGPYIPEAYSRHHHGAAGPTTPYGGLQFGGPGGAHAESAAAGSPAVAESSAKQFTPQTGAHGNEAYRNEAHGDVAQVDNRYGNPAQGNAGYDNAPHVSGGGADHDYV